jgi:O-antigen/teichoic acid export membrane protein
MSSELKRGTIRVASNYARLFATLALGLVLVPLLFRTLGPDAAGLIGTLGASFGLATIFTEIARESMIRELGAAHHNPATDVFLRVYNSAIFVSLGFALLSLVTFGIFLLLLPWVMQSVDPVFLTPARWFLFAAGLEVSLEVVLSPQINMMIATERRILYNAFFTVHRTAYVVLALLLLWVWTDLPSQQGLVVFGVGAAIAQALMASGMAGWLIFSDRRLVPRSRYASVKGIKEILAIGGWNTGIGVAMRLHERAASIIMVINFGAWGGVIFDQIAFRLTSYVRMIAWGITGGTDAVAARLHMQEDHPALRQLLRDSTRLHGIAVFPSVVGLLMLSGPLITAWIAPSLADPGSIIPAATMMTQILVVGSASRSIADGWIRILYGAGHIASYAPLILIGGVLNPITSLLLLMVLPDPWRYTAVAWVYSGTLALFHIVLLPLKTAKLIGIRPRDMVTPLIGPALLAAGCAPILLLARPDGEGHVTLIRLVATCGSFGVVYLLLTYFLVLPVEIRERLMNVAKRKLGRPAC